MNLKLLPAAVLTLALACVLASAVSSATPTVPGLAASQPRNATERSFAVGGGLVQTIDLLMSADVPAAEAERVAESFFDDRFASGTIVEYVTTPNSWPASSIPVTISYNQSLAGEPSLKDAGDIAVARWNTIPGSTFRMVSGGTTAAVAGACQSPLALDGQSTLTFADTGGSSVLGLTCAVSDSSRKIVEADIIFSPSVLFSSASVTPNNAYDFVSVVLHELGHFASLDHPCQQGACNGYDAVMVPTLQQGQQRRTPRPDDVMGLNSKYPASRSVLPFRAYTAVVVGDSPR